MTLVLEALRMVIKKVGFRCNIKQRKFKPNIG